MTVCHRSGSSSVEGCWRGLYFSTFCPDGPAPPHEATHRDTLQFGYLASELEACHVSFGYSPA